MSDAKLCPQGRGSYRNRSIDETRQGAAVPEDVYQIDGIINITQRTDHSLALEGLTSEAGIHGRHLITLLKKKL